jgi:hypothetical protein
VFAAIGAKALLLLYIWMRSAIACGRLSVSKGYTERAGLGTGVLISFVGLIVWLLMPAKADADWHTHKPWQRRHKPTEAEMSGSAAAGL